MAPGKRRELGVGPWDGVHDLPRRAAPLADAQDGGGGLVGGEERFDDGLGDGNVERRAERRYRHEERERAVARSLSGPGAGPPLTHARSDLDWSDIQGGRREAG